MLTGKTTQIYFILVLAFFSLPSHAFYRHYEAELDKASWEVESSPLFCRLKHNIPKFGQAVFESTASKDRALSFSVSSFIFPEKQKGKANIHAVAPPWRHGFDSLKLASADLNDKQFLTLSESQSWMVLHQLQRGMYPTIYYDDWIESKDRVAVAVSAAKFAETSQQFDECLANLLPYTFEDIKNSTVYFDFGSASLTKQTQERLTQVRNYLEADKQLQVVLIYGHTDSKGGRSFNRFLGERRAQSVQQFLMQAGLDASKFHLESYGEKKPIKSNKTAEGRALNRRVIVRIRK